jgi:uncharacterized protein (DUF1501 family)
MNNGRRDFLRATAGVSVLAMAPRAFAQAPETRRLLILVELKGGNDGLNTVIPHEDPAYARIRPRLAIERDQRIPITEKEALHPSLEKLVPIWREGRLAIVQGLGYPDPNLSHFRSIEIWDTASRSDEYLEEGWLARAFAISPSPATFVSDGVVVGSAELGPLAGQSSRAIALTDPERFLRSARLARAEGEGRNPALRHILKVEGDVQRSARRITTGHELKTEFPAGPFGNAVKTAAQLAANPAGVAVIRVSLNGFDTHANQPNVHANLLRQLAEGLAALRNALEETGRWNDTVIATYSEFGRRPRENQSNGTDHGTAGVHFVLGPAVKGGMYGAPPALDRLDGNGNLRFAVDFRGYYATFLDRWWGIDSRKVLAGRYPPLPFIS